MKKALLWIFVLLPFLSVAQGDLGFYFQDIAVIPADFEANAKKFESEKKETLRAVRIYIEAKETALDELVKKIEIVENDRAINMIDTVAGSMYLRFVDSAKESDVICEKLKHYMSELGYMPQFYGDRKVADLDIITDKIRKKVTCLKKDYQLMNILHTSRKNLNEDIDKAQLRIDHLYGNLYDDGKFRLWITGIFSTIVGALLLFFFIFITRMSESTLAKDFLSSGNGLQFITLFSLIIAIILFGVLGVLEGRELAAILSGISGYILGKGIQNPAKGNDKKTDETKPDAKAGEGKE